jgi:cell wall-associated NlpC family hydrolase
MQDNIAETQRAALIAAARREIGTPFHHRGRAPGHALDCIGLIVVAARAAGLEIEDVCAYDADPTGIFMYEAARRGVAVMLGTPNALKPGDVLLIQFANEPHHVALISAVHPTDPPTMIHSWAGVGKVVEHHLDLQWNRRILGARRFRELADL